MSQYGSLAIVSDRRILITSLLALKSRLERGPSLLLM
jgi:hypothetical protein